MKIEDGGPAYPCPEAGVQHFSDMAAYTGMTLRDYFAAGAVQGLLSNQAQDYAPMTPIALHAVVLDAWKIADAMIKYRD